MEHVLRLISLACIGLQLTLGQDEDLSEPKCYSRFDYDHKVLMKLITLETTQNKLQDVITQQRETIESLRSDLEATKTLITDKVEQLARSVSVDESGTTYIRWGRTECPSNGTELVYDGYAGSSHFTHTGGAANTLCLPKDPIWGYFQEGYQSSSYVYGSEYQFHSMDKFFERSWYDSDIPCAVCRTKRASTMMLPARNECYDGWILKYKGYLSAGKYDHASATEYVCMDISPEAIPDSAANNNGRMFHATEARCGSLKCPPYVEGLELTCAFCSK